MSETELARMVISLMGDATSYLGMLKRATSATQVATQAISQQSMKIEGYGRSLVSYASQAKFAILSAVGVVGLFGTALGALERAVSGEQIELAFEVLVGDAKLAKATLEDLRKFAAETPFELPEILAASKQMIAFGSAAQDIVPTMRMLGDVASGLNIPLGDLIYLYGTLKSQVVAHTVDIMQFASRGIPIWENLAKVMFNDAKATQKVRDALEHGKVTFVEVEKAFKLMTGEGGKFGGMMEKQSQTLGGLWSTFKDEVGMTLRIIGDNIVRAFGLKDAVRAMTTGAGEVKKWVVILANGFIFLKDSITNAVKANIDFIISAAKVIAIASGVWATFKIGALALGAVSVILKILKVDLILSTTLWLVWTSAILAAKGVLLIFSLGLLTFNIVLAAANLLTGLWAAGSIAATAATWLWNTALVALNAALAVPAIIAFAAALVVIVASFAAVYGAVVGVIQVATSLINVFSELSISASGALNEVTRLFGRWQESISDITRAIQVDFGLAWRFAVAYGRLAVEQIKDLWPPLWQLLQDGFQVVWRLTSFMFVTEFKRGFAEVLAQVAKHASIFKVNKDKIQQDIDMMNKHVEEGQGKAVEGAGKMLTEILNKFKVVEGEGAKAAIQALGGLRQELGIREGFKQIRDAGSDLEDSLKKSGEAAGKGIDEIGKSAVHATNAIIQLNSVSSYSQAGFARLKEHQDFLRSRGTGIQAIDPKTGQGAFDSKKSETLLKLIADNTKFMKENEKKMGWGPGFKFVGI